MKNTAVALALLLVGCARRHAEEPRPCSSADECTRAYQKTLGEYNHCKDSHYGSQCPDEENAMTGAYQRMKMAENREFEAYAEEKSRLRNIEHAKEEKAKREQAVADQKEQAALRAIEEQKRQKREAAEQARVEAHEQELREATEARQSPVVNEAKRRGFKTVVFSESGGLIAFIAQVTSLGSSATELPSVMIELSDDDSGFIAQFKSPNGDWLFTQMGTGVFFKAPPGQTIYPGTRLTSLNVEAVKITGTRTYAMARQAFVIQRVY